MSSYDYDLFTIGAGSGGVRAARFSAGFGARVAVAEHADLGGTCVNVGCIPKKLMAIASHFAEDFEDATHGYGWTIPQAPTFDWPTFRENKDREIARLNGVYRRLLEGCDLFESRARITGPHSVEVEGRHITAETILVCTGGWPRIPEAPGAELAITSNEAFHLETLPERVLVIGGGYIAVEFAGIFHGMGSSVSLVHRGPVFLRGFDDDLRHGLADAMREKGIALHFEQYVENLQKTSGGLRATLTDGTRLDADCVLCAIGRVPRSGDIGLEATGVALDGEGAVIVDEYSRTNVPSIYAIGDVTNRINLTPVAIREGTCLANTLFNQTPMSPDHRDVPSAVFSQPPIGTVGLTETEAREQYGEIDVYRSTFQPLRLTIAERGEQMIMKLLVDRASERVVGVHVLGPDAAEIVQGFAVAVKCGATKAQFDATVGIHPTSAEELVTMREPLAD